MAEERMLNDEILLGLIKANGGGGGGGTTNYNDLSNQPQINGNTLTGNKSASDLGLVAAVDGKGLSTNDYTDADKAIVDGVTAALAGKQDTLTVGDYIDITSGEISVNREIPNETVSYEFKTKGTSEPNIAIIVTKRSNSSVVWEREYQYLDVLTPIVIDDVIKFGYQWVNAGQWTYEMLVASDSHAVGYRQSWGYLETKDYTEDFSLIDNTGLKLIIKSEMDTALAGKQNTLTFDSVPTDGSTNPVESNGIYDALALKQNATDNSLETDAKTIVGAINEHEGDVSSLKSGLTTLDNEVNGDATVYPYADVITIPDAIPANVADCTVKIEPVQDLHGFDHPWVGGAWKNKYSTTAGADAWSNNNASHSNDNGTLVITYNANMSTPGIYADSGNVMRGLINGASSDMTVSFSAYATTENKFYIGIGSNPKGVTIKTTAERYFVTFSAGYSGGFVIYQQNDNKIANTVYIFDMQVETGSTATDYAPYENICPITGHTEASVQRVGKNLFNVSRYPFVDSYFIKATDGTAQPTSSAYKASSVYIHCSHLRGETLVLNKRPGGNDTGIAFYEDENVNSYISGVRNAGGEAGTPMTFEVPNNANYFKFTVPLSATDVQIEIGTESTPYVPYAGKTYTIALGDTIYGGTVDFDSGVMTVTDGIIALKDLSWAYVSQSTRFIAGISGAKMVDASTIADILCEIFKTVSWNDYGSVNYDCICLANIGGTNYVGLKCLSCESVDDLLVVLDNYKMTYPLATPFTVQLTPTQIQLLKGQNTLTASTGQISVTVNGVSGAIGSLQTQANATNEALAELAADIAEKLPTAPTTDGAYVLTVTVADGTPTYSWESAT